MKKIRLTFSVMILALCAMAILPTAYRPECVLFPFSIAQAEKAALFQAYPVFSADYGFEAYYEDLIAEEGGIFRGWSVRSKARLSKMLPKQGKAVQDASKALPNGKGAHGNIPSGFRLGFYHHR